MTTVREAARELVDAIALKGISGSVGDCAQALRTALAAESERVSEWQPIETAPKDRDVLLTEGKLVSQGGWITDCAQGAEYEGQCGLAGWWSVESIESPTYWISLPQPPMLAAAERERARE